jgi:hypothetical protein
LGRRRPRARALGLALALAAGGAVARDVPLRAQRWLAPGTDVVAALAFTPTECLTKPTDPQHAYSVEVGRAAFRTPVLLGGQAARAGVNCETCHRGGRTNPDFQFPGVSGAPGTADVTSSLFSSHRGDGIDDPKPIPDLSGPKARLKIAQAPADHALEPFIHGLIVEEFDGPEPSPAVLQGLADYVRALSPAACPAGPQPVTVQALMADARRALSAARAAQARGDRPTAVLMVAAARTRLGLIDERYTDAGLAPERERLRAADARLAAAAQALREGRPQADADLAAWLRDAPPLETALIRAQPRSLFNPRRLAAGA